MGSRASFARSSLAAWVLATLACVPVALGSLAVDEQGRYYLYVLDSAGNPTDATDDVEVRPHSDTSPGAAIDAFFLGGFSSTWYWSVEWFDDEEVYKLYVNGAAQQDSLSMDNAIENSIAPAALQADAVTPPKLDEDGNFQLDPANTTASLRFDFDTTDPAGGKAIEIDFGGQVQTGIDLGTVSVTNSIGLSGIVGGSANAEVISLSNTSSGASSRALAVTTSATGASAAGVEITNSSTGVGQRIVNTAGSGAPVGLRIENDALGATLPYGLQVTSDNGGRAAWLTGEELLLGLEAGAHDDTTVYVSGGHILIEPENVAYSANGMIDLQLPDLFQKDGIYVVTSATATGRQDGIHVLHDSGSDQDSRGIYVRHSSTGFKNAGIKLFSNADDSFGLHVTRNNFNIGGVGIFANNNSNSAPPPEADRQVAIFEYHDNGTVENEVVRIEQHDAYWGLLSFHDGPADGSAQGAVWASLDATSDDQGYVYRGGVGGTAPAGHAFRAEFAPANTGNALDVFYNGSSDGSVIDIDYANSIGKIYNGPGMIHIDEDPANFVANAPFLYADVATGSSTKFIDLQTTSGIALEIESSQSYAMQVDDGFVDMNDADWVAITTHTTQGAVTLEQDGVITFTLDDDALNVYDGTTWFSVGLSSGAAAKVGGADADTLLIPFRIGDNWKGTGCSSTYLSSGHYPANRITATDGNWCAIIEQIIPNLGTRTTVEVTWNHASSTGAGNDQVVTQRLLFRAPGEAVNVSYTESVMDTTTMVATSYAPTAHTVTFNSVTAGGDETMMLFEIEREADDAGDTDTGDTWFFGGHFKIY